MFWLGRSAFGANGSDVVVWVSACYGSMPFF